jgi:RHS repeat-associated protein
MIQPGRKYTAGSQYRYGYNGKEGDTEMGAEAYDYGSRIYDARIGKWLSIDPLTNLYPMYTPYHYAGNNPILFIDRDGEDFYVYGSETEWAKFKTALENSYGGLITLERDKKTNKVTMHVSQKKVDEMNKKASKSGDNALAKIKLKEQYAVIFNADKHKKSTKIKLADTDAEKKSTWGGAFRGGTLNGEYQVIDMDDLPILSKDSKVMTQLGNIIHEVREAFEDQAVQGHPKAADKAARDAIFDKAHAQALKSQAKVDGWDVVYSRILEGYYIPEFGNGAKHIQMFGGKKNKKGEMEYTLSVIILTRDGKFVDIKNFKVDKVVIKDGVVASFNIIK